MARAVAGEVINLNFSEFVFIQGFYYAALLGALLFLPGLFLLDINLVLTPSAELDDRMRRRLDILKRIFPKKHRLPAFRLWFEVGGFFIKWLAMAVIAELTVFFAVGTFVSPDEIRQHMKTVGQYWDVWCSFPAWVVVLLVAGMLLAVFFIMLVFVAKGIHIQQKYLREHEELIALRKKHDASSVISASMQNPKICCSSNSRSDFGGCVQMVSDSIKKGCSTKKEMQQYVDQYYPYYMKINNK